MESAPLIAPLAVDEWFQAMPEVLTPVSWSLALARPNAQLWHRSCPWGGHLIKFDTWPHHFWDTTCGQSDVLDATPRCVKSWASHAKKQMCEYHVKLRTNQVPCKWLYAWPLECAADLIFESAFKGLSPRIMFRTQFSLFDHTCHPRTSKAFKSRMPQKRPAT